MLQLDENSLVCGLTQVVSRTPSGDRTGARRGLRLALGLAALALLLFGAAAVAPTGEGNEPDATIASGHARGEFGTVMATPETVVATVRPQPPTSIVRTFLDTGGTLAGSLASLGVPVELRPNLIAAIGDYVDPRKLPSGTGLSAVVDDRGVPSRVALRTGPERFVRLTLPTDERTTLRSELIKLPVVTSLETLGGVVKTSVAQAFSHSAHGIHLTNAFADVFQWDVDLLVDPRPGDTVRIVYEAQRLGDVPADLPGFAGAASEAGDFLQLGRVLAAKYEGAMARSAGFWIDGPEGSGGYYDDRGHPLRKAFLKSPLNYRRISSGFSRARRNPVTRRVVPHHGVDFAAATGTPVVATADGRVESAGWNGPLGRAVRLQHGGTFATIYGHLNGFAPGIRPGVEVKQNQVIGYVGSTGRATGPHLHYTLMRAGRAINPMTFQNPPAEPLPSHDGWRLEEAKRRWLPVLYAINPDKPTEGYEVAGGQAGIGRVIRPGA